VEALTLDAFPAWCCWWVAGSREFLDNIEPSERVCHLGDPAGVIRRALGRLG
jgi:hypothetical protein